MALQDKPKLKLDISSPKSTEILEQHLLSPKDRSLSPSDLCSPNGILPSPRNSLADISFGQEYEYVEEPPPEYYCPITLELLVDPHQTACCGNHVSSGAASTLQEESKDCPICKEPKFSSVPDKHYQRKILSLKVYCPHDGCNWIGEVKYYNRHVSECPKRSWSCEYCDFTCTHEEGESVHWPQCEMFPEPCPNKCEVKFVPRKDVQQHRTVCSLEPVNCDLSQYGCQAVLPRRDIPQHMKEGEIKHLLMLGIQNYKQLKNNKESIAELQRCVNQLQQSLHCVQTGLADVRKKTAHIEQHTTGDNALSCTLHTFPNFSTHKLSQNDYDSKPFEVNGYHFNLRIRFYCPPFDMVVAFLGLLHSNDDSELIWPVKVACQLEQLNQAGNNHHRVSSLIFTWNKEERGAWKTIDTYDMKYSELEKKKPGINFILNDTLMYRLHINILP